MVKKKSEDVTSWKDIPKILLTFALVCFGYLLFRAETLKDAIEIINQIIISNTKYSNPLKTNTHIILLIKALIGLFILFLVELRFFNMNNRFLLYILIFSLLFLCSFRNSISFIYFQF